MGAIVVEYKTLILSKWIQKTPTNAKSNEQLKAARRASHLIASMVRPRSGI